LPMDVRPSRWRLGDNIQTLGDSTWSYSLRYR
jgi:hypothetical protein